MFFPLFISRILRCKFRYAISLWLEEVVKSDDTLEDATVDAVFQAVCGDECHLNVKI